MAKPTRVEDLPPAVQAQAYRQLAGQLENGDTPTLEPQEPQEPRKWYTQVFRYHVFAAAYVLLGLGSVLGWIGKHLETLGKEVLTWIRAQM